MSDIKFTVTHDELEDARQEYYLQGIMQGEDNINDLWNRENTEWQVLTRKLRELAEKHGATWEEVNACWKVQITDPKAGSTSEDRS